MKNRSNKCVWWR